MDPCRLVTGAEAHSENGAANEPRFLRSGAEARSRSADVHSENGAASEPRFLRSGAEARSRSADVHSENGAANEPRFLRPGAEARSRSAERILKTERPSSRGFYVLARKRVQEARSAL